jgi:hypothetical protein
MMYDDDMDMGHEVWQPTNVWVTREGDRIPFEFLSVCHLENIVKMLVRKAKAGISDTQAFYLTCPEPDGTGCFQCRVRLLV